LSPNQSLFFKSGISLPFLPVIVNNITMDNIVGTLRRVISEPDNVGTDNPHEVLSNHDANYLADDQGLQTMDSALRPPAVVEVESPMDVGRAVIHITDDTLSNSSSLSDGNEQFQQLQHHQQLQHARMHMHRNYSVDSSVNSSARTSHGGSGNWGWFEDVHDTRAPKKAKNQSGAEIMPSNGNGEFIVHFGCFP